MGTQGREHPTGKRVGQLIRTYRRNRKIWQPDFFYLLCAVMKAHYPEFYDRHLGDGKIVAVREWVGGIENGRTVKMFHYVEFYDCTAIALKLSWPERVDLFLAGGMDPMVTALGNMQEIKRFGSQLFQDTEHLVMNQIMPHQMTNGVSIPTPPPSVLLELYLEAIKVVGEDYRKRLK